MEHKFVERTPVREMRPSGVAFYEERETQDLPNLSISGFSSTNGAPVYARSRHGPSVSRKQIFHRTMEHYFMEHTSYDLKVPTNSEAHALRMHLSRLCCYELTISRVVGSLQVLSIAANLIAINMVLLRLCK